MQEIKLWLKWRNQAQTLEGLFKGIGKARMTEIKRRCFYAILAAIVYNIWRVRNDVYWSSKV